MDPIAYPILSVASRTQSFLFYFSSLIECLIRSAVQQGNREGQTRLRPSKRMAMVVSSFSSLPVVMLSDVKFRTEQCGRMNKLCTLLYVITCSFRNGAEVKKVSSMGLQKIIVEFRFPAICIGTKLSAACSVQRSAGFSHTSNARRMQHRSTNMVT